VLHQRGDLSVRELAVKGANEAAKAAMTSMSLMTLSRAPTLWMWCVVRATALVLCCVIQSPVWAQPVSTSEEVQKGHQLAVMVCSACHLAAPDQESLPIRRPAAPAFSAIAQRPNLSAESLETFLMTTHRGLDKPTGMANPQLLDSQVKEVTAYILSLRKKP